MFAATGTAFVICRYDPFVGFFRHQRQHEHARSRGVLPGRSAFSSAGRIADTCVLTGPFSGLSRRRRSGTRGFRPTSASNAGCARTLALTARSASRPPPSRRPSGGAAATAGLAVASARVLIAAGFWLGRQLEDAAGPRCIRWFGWPSASVWNRRGEVEGTIDASDAFRNTGRPADELYREATRLAARFRQAGGWFGAWVGLVVGVEIDLSLASAAGGPIISPIGRRASPAAAVSGIVPASRPGKDGFKHRAGNRGTMNANPNDAGLSAGHADRGRGRRSLPSWSPHCCSYDYIRRLAKGPAGFAAYKTLVGRARPAPTQRGAQGADSRARLCNCGESISASGRSTGVGAALLMVAVAIFLLSARMAATLRRRMPSPGVSLGRARPRGRLDPHRPAGRWRRCAWFVAAAVVLSVGRLAGRDFPQCGEETVVREQAGPIRQCPDRSRG